jgi:hypothetical protein
MPIPHRELLAVDREFKPLIVGTLGGGEAGAEQPKFKSF